MGASNPNARACSDLLSREAFPLHTLNNHPIAPVLLRMPDFRANFTVHIM